MHQGVGIDEVRVASAFNSIKRRAEHLQERGRTKNLNAAKAGTVAGSTAGLDDRFGESFQDKGDRVVL